MAKNATLEKLTENITKPFKARLRHHRKTWNARWKVYRG